MTVTKQLKKMEFIEQDEDFIKKLAKDIGCHYSKSNTRTYSLNKFKSDVQSEKGAFAWVHKDEPDYFWVATRKIWLEAAKTHANAGRKISRTSFIPRDTQLANDSVNFDARENYHNTVSSLKLVNKMR